MNPGVNPLGRLLSRAEFERVSSCGRRFRSDYLRLIVHENGLDKANVGITVPYHTVKSAVRRNRLKRVLRERLRDVSLSIAPGYDLVLTVLLDPGGNDSEKLGSELKHLLQKSGLWKGEDE